MQVYDSFNILIAEDDFIVSESIQKEVEDLGYTVVGKAPDGRMAVEMTKSLKPDMVLMDIQMPDMDGLQATEEICQTCPTPVVMLTAYDTQDLVVKAGQAGAGAYLVKMPTGQELERAIIIASARFDDMRLLRQLNTEFQEAADKVKLLSGIIPICASCKKIRDDENYWHDVASYIRDHSEAEFTHSICPECVKLLYPGYGVYSEDDEDNL
jgi:AmiR/NasT family two-component response regulator